MYDFNEIIQEGDYVIVCQGYNTYKCMQIENGKKFQNSHGQFFCDDIIGRPYGSRVCLLMYYYYFFIQYNIKFFFFLYDDSIFSTSINCIVFICGDSKYLKNCILYIKNSAS